MLDTDFDDFLDSDDDALFVEASNSLIDCYSTLSETTGSLHKNEPKGGLAECLQVVENNVPQNKLENASSHHFELQDIPLFHTPNSKPDYGMSVLTSKKNSVETEKTLSTTSTRSSISNISVGNKTSENSYIDNRFTPGFTPKAKKRKLPGPAGLLELCDESEETEPGNSHKMPAVDIEFENIVSSQFTLEHLSLSSWQKLQAAVSSCSDHSTAKYYSIKRVFKESSKRKLPKHMVVPILCVLLKKIAYKGSACVSVFMDDTGEINGKIDADVLSMYKEYIVEGTAFILKKVTFLFNTLLLKAENLVSIYHPDGTEKHPQTLKSLLETSEPLKAMKCECPKLTCMKNSVNNGNTPSGLKFSCISHKSNKLHNISNQTTNVNKNASNLNPKPSSTVIKTSTNAKSMRSDAFLEGLLDDGNCIDEFDVLLGNLDEKSFMEDL